MKLISTIAAALFASMALAAPVANLRAQERAPAKGYRLLATAEDKPAFWVAPEVIDVLGNSELNFIDITDHQVVDPSRTPVPSSIPSGPTHQSEVFGFINQIDSDLYEENLIAFSSFRNRYYSSSYGLESANFLFDAVSEIAATHSNVTVTKFPHTWSQYSIIARINPSSTSKEVVILGAHQDSTAGSMPSGSAPGADDDGSGSMAILEIFRILASNDFRPEHAIEFHWYSAEEVGLLGSQAVAKSYQDQGASVRSMMQLDMIAYNTKESTVGIITDYVDADTIQFNRQLVDEYLNIGWTNSLCGYGCSDHASWNRYGYRSSFPFEAQFRNRNPSIHTTQDTMSLVNIGHAAEFIKLGLSFAVELSYL